MKKRYRHFRVLLTLLMVGPFAASQNAKACNTTSNINVNACVSYESPSGKYSWNQAGVYRDTIPNAAGCDSIITVALLITDISNSTHQRVGDSLIASVIWAHHYQWVNCDSNYLGVAADSHRVFHPPYSGNFAVITTLGPCIDTTPCEFFQKPCVVPGTTIQLQGCDSVISPSGAYVWTYSGIYLDTLQSSGACDSILLVHVNIAGLNGVCQQFGDSMVAQPAMNTTYQWINCSNVDSAIAGETNRVFYPQSSGLYAVIVSNGTCIDTSDCESFITTSIPVMTEDRIRIYPNPGSEYARIESQSPVCVRLYSLDGRLLQIYDVSNAPVLDLRSLAPGTYVVKIENEEMSITRKLVKQ